jgi:hypothetical protein
VRFGGAFTYNVPVTPGRTYRVRLTFSEVYFNEAGSRRVNVALNGVRVVDGLDVFAEAGGRFRPVIREAEVAVSTGQLTIALTGAINNAILAAYEVGSCRWHCIIPR